MSDFVKVAKVQQIHEQRTVLVAINGKEIALFKRNGEVFAINNVCAHQHFSMLHEGDIEGFEVTCPMHGWRYDLRTGLSTTGQGKVARYNVSIVGEDVLIEVPDSL